MAKQPNSAIDYTPKHPKAYNPRANERVIHGVVQRTQHYPIFEVTSAGKCVEWTDIRKDAHAAFADTTTRPKRLVLVHADGRRVLLDEVSATGRRLAQPEPDRLAA